MRNFRGKKIAKRILSVVLVFAMLLGAITFSSKPESVKAAAGDSALKTFYDGSKKVVRGVMSDIADLPQKQYNDKWKTESNPEPWKKLNVGTADRPFFILEIVPNIEYGEFGYLIGGCEPLALEKANGYEKVLDYPETMNTGIVTSNSDNGATYFFQDEPESKESYYETQTNPWDNGINSSNPTRFLSGITVKGYYEVVEPTKGKFEIKTTVVDGVTKKTIESKDGGNVIWHTMNKMEQKYSSETEFNQLLSGVRMEEVGDRLYTTRKSTDDDLIVKVDEYKYQYYKNNEVFIRDVVGLSDAKAVDNFSVVYKAITPEEINDTPEWIDYADLIYLNDANFDVGRFDDLKTYWDKFNRLGKTWSVPTNAKKDYSDHEDLTYNVVMKIFDKVTAETNYAALLVDSKLYESFNWQKYKDGKYAIISKEFDVLDFNLTKIGNSGNQTGHSQNFYKLLLMTCTMNPNLVKQIFREHMHCAEFAYTSGYNGWYLVEGTKDSEALKNNPNGKIIFDDVIQNSGRNMQKCYWWDGIFTLIDRDVLNKSGYTTGQLYNYVISQRSTYWNNYNIQDSEIFKQAKTYVQGRVYTYNSNGSIASKLRSGEVNDGSGGTSSTAMARYTDYYEFLHSDPDTKRIWETNNPDSEKDYDSDINQSTAPPSSALRYILGLGVNQEQLIYSGDLKILEIEPATSLDSKGIYPVWKTSKTFFHMMLPNFNGKIEVDHYTMPAFVGKVDDLNSNYDMVYLGADLSGFRSGTDSEGKTACPLFYNDQSLNNKIYYHVGDIFHCLNYSSGEGKRYFNTIGDSDDAREPGNDITQVKNGFIVESGTVKQIKVNVGNFYEYIMAGFPIMAEDLLYESGRIDTESNMYQLLTRFRYSATNPLTTKSGIFLRSEVDLVEQRIKANNMNVTFTALPKKYEYETLGADRFNDTSLYLPTTGRGTAKQSYMRFGFKVDQGNKVYSYRFYVDQDRNGKFDSSDIVMSNTLETTDFSYTYTLSEKVIGIIQWRIEVYKTENPTCRVCEDGFSAAKNWKGDDKKEQLRVLQVLPNNQGRYAFRMDDADYVAKYTGLDAFDITVDVCTWEEFNLFFKNMPGGKFTYNLGEGVTSSNPGKTMLDQACSLTKADGTSKGLPTGIKPLNNYNMLVFGFQDIYGGTDMSNQNGAVEYLYYFAMSGEGSILFSHDTTSMYNYIFPEDNPSGVEKRSYGTTANTIMRDIMGMNRFGTTSKLLTDTKFRAGLKDEFVTYRENREKAGLLYDKTSKDENQGLTYAALLNMSKNSRFTLANMCAIGDGGDQRKGKTNRVKNLNKGQISEYPYNIKDEIPVAQTHCQLYQLNLEDPELNVWYTLCGSAASDGKLNDAGGTKELVTASPQDAANSYYIYSKGNIFYTGVGHNDPPNRSAQTPQEIELFVNTMVAAYRAGATKPSIVIKNSDVSKKEGEYYLPIPKELYYDGDVLKDTADDNFGINSVTVYFSPMDSNFSNDMYVWAFYGTESWDGVEDSDGDGTLTETDFTSTQNAKKAKSILTVYDESNNAINAVYGEVFNSSTNKWYTGWYLPHLQHGHIYHFDYQKSDLKDKPDIMFEIYSDRYKDNDRGETKLHLFNEPLFLLD